MEKAHNPNVGNVLKILGFTLMVIDHGGHFLFPELLILRIIGRLAFPFFLYGVVVGVNYTRNIYKYAVRMALMGIVSIFAWGSIAPLNIGFSLAIIILGLHFIQEKHYPMALLMLVLSNFVEYGAYGFIFAMILFYFLNGRMTKTSYIVWMIILHMYSYYTQGMIQPFALLALPVISFVIYLVDKGLRAPKIGKVFGYSFYPVHVFILRMLSALL